MQNQSHDFNQLNYDTALYYHPTASMAPPVAGVDSLYDVETSPQQTTYPIPSWASNPSLSPVTPIVHDDASTPTTTTTSSPSSSSTRSNSSKSRTGGNRSKRPKRKQVKNACGKFSFFIWPRLHNAKLFPFCVLSAFGLLYRGTSPLI